MTLIYNQLFNLNIYGGSHSALSLAVAKNLLKIKLQQRLQMPNFNISIKSMKNMEHLYDTGLIEIEITADEERALWTKLSNPNFSTEVTKFIDDELEHYLTET